ncbi:MAG: glycosyltransferase family 4 protein [Verrucomicrobia bacterium]|nr:glycosyltransferase family 4 protein [Verrucomicrobiota bacterium]
MKIGLVRRGFSRTGGAEAYLKRLGRALADAGHEVTLYGTADWPPAEWPYGKVVPVPGDTPASFAQNLQAIQPGVDVLFSLERILRCDCYRAGDGVHARWLERRRAHEPGWRDRLRFTNRKHQEIQQLEESLLRQRKAREVITNSDLVKREIMAAFNYPAEQISVIRNGLPEAQFRKRPGTRQEWRNRWELHGNEIAVLFAGSGWFRKGLHYALEAMAAIKDPRVRLLVAGEGRKPWPVPSNVRFLGAVTDMGSLYGAADMFVLPTIYDPFSNACLEAASFGLPVITTAANGFAEIMRPGTHGDVIADAKNVPALRAAIEKWLDPRLREGVREACIELARRHSMRDNLQQTLSVLQRLAGSAPSPARG